MSEHKAVIDWKCDTSDFLKGKYSREHTWTFDGGAVVQASPAPSSVPAPYSNAAFVDPEEAFVASVASCHMLTFLWVAYKAGFQIDGYHDAAVGHMIKNEGGVPWVHRIELRPKIQFAEGKGPDAERLHELHHAAHEQCFIANSIKTEVLVLDS